MKPKTLFLMLFIALFFLSCEEDDEQYKTFNEAFLTEVIRNGETESLLEYNSSGQVIKTTFYDHVYRIYEYNTSGKLVKISMYNGPDRPEYEDQLGAYDTIIYETNKIIVESYGIASNFELSYYQEYILNSDNECVEIIFYSDKGVETESTEYTWSKGNMVEYTTTYSDGSWRHGIYEYDNEHNPFTLCSHILDPWLLTKNNRTRMIIDKSYEEEIDTIICTYTYNEYGFPIHVSTTWSTNPDNTRDESYSYVIE